MAGELSYKESTGELMYNTVSGQLVYGCPDVSGDVECDPGNDVWKASLPASVNLRTISAGDSSLQTPAQAAIDCTEYDGAWNGDLDLVSNRYHGPDKVGAPGYVGNFYSHSGVVMSLVTLTPFCDPGPEIVSATLRIVILLSGSCSTAYICDYVRVAGTGAGVKGKYVIGSSPSGSTWLDGLEWWVD